MKRLFLILFSMASVIPVIQAQSTTTQQEKNTKVHHYVKSDSPKGIGEKTTEVKAAVARLNKAMIDADGKQLYALTYPALQYGHSSGVIQDQKTFVDGITSGRSDFLTIDLSDETIDIVGNTACVRHLLSAKTFDNKVPGTVQLEILLVWVKQGHQWRLLARQAVKPPVK